MSQFCLQLSSGVPLKRQIECRTSEHLSDCSTWKHQTDSDTTEHQCECSTSEHQTDSDTTEHQCECHNFILDQET